MTIEQKLGWAMCNFSFLFGGAIFLIGCATGPSVIERADNLSSKPEWASLLRSVYEEEGAMYFLGYVEVQGDASKSAALNMSDEKGMSEPFRALTDAFLDQNQVGEELRKDSAVGQRLISATRGYRPPMGGLHVVKRYWEVVRVPNQDDPDVTRAELRSYSLVMLPKSDFEAAKRAYFDRLNGNSEVKTALEDIRKKQAEQVMSH
jgi:hypothetical protein